MIRKLLFSSLFFIMVSATWAQVTLNFNPLDTTAAVGSIVTIKVDGTNMVNVAAVELHYEWDSTVIKLVDPANPVQNVNPNFSGIGWQANSPSSSTLIFQWFDTIEHNVPGTLFEIPFQIVGAGTTNLYYTSAVISDLSLNQYTVTVDTATITGTSGGSANPLALEMENITAQTGTDTCVKVKVVSDFDSITKLDFSLSWNGSVLSYTSVNDLNSTLGLTTSNFDLTSAGTGKLGFSYSDAAGKTLSAGDVLFSVCYHLSGAGGTSSLIPFGNDPTPIAVENTLGPIGNSFADGNVTITGNSGGGPDTIFHLMIPDTVFVAGSGDSICVPVTVKNFNKMTDVAFSINWDTTVLKYSSASAIENPNSPGNPLGAFNTNYVNAGKLGYVYFEFGSGNTSLPDYSELINVCFQVVGNVGDVSPINFTNDPVTIAAHDSVHADLGYPMTVDTVNGSVTISASDTFHLFAGYDSCTQGVVPGDTIALDFKVKNLKNMTAFQAKYLFDTTRFEALIPLSNSTVVLPHDPLIQLFNPSTNGDQVILIWLSENTAPYTWPDSMVIGTLYLRAKPGAPVGSADLTVVPGSTAAGGPFGNVPHVVHDIALSVVDSLQLNATVTNVSCGGTNDGSILLSPTGWTGNYTYDWSGPGGPFSGAGIAGIGPGTYTVTVTSCNASKVESYTITQPTPFTLSVVSAVNEATPPGQNGSIEVTAGGASGVSYSWTGPGGPYSGSAISGLTQGIYTVIGDDGQCADTLTVQLFELTASGSKTDVSCNGGNDGAIALTVSGGTPPYSYQWNMGPGGSNPTGLTAGTYSVTVTDNTNAEIILTFDISEPSAIAIQLDSTVNTPVGSNSGGVYISVSGGTPGYTYQWTGGATTQDLVGVGVGSYSVTVTDNNGCTKVAGPYNVSDFGTPNPVVAVNAVSCNGGNDGTITISSISGGVPDYTVSGIGAPQTTNGTTPVVFSGLTANTYTLTITDSNATDTTFTVVVPEPAPMVISNVNITPSSGLNGSITYDLSGGTPPYSFDWDHDAYDGLQNIFGLLPETYVVTITDANGCTLVQSFDVPQANAPVPVVTTTDVMCFGESTGVITISSITGDNPNFTVTGTGLSTQVTDGNTPVVYSNLPAASYTITVTDAIGSDTTFTVAINQPSEITFDGIVVVHEEVPPGSNGSISLTVNGGNPPYSYSWSPGNYSTEDISGLTAGNYTLTVVDASGCVKVSQPIAVLQTQAGFSCSTDPTDTDCPNSQTGKIILTVSGGQPPLTYQWEKDNSGTIFSQDKNLVNIGVGYYSVTVTDANGSITTCDATVGSVSSLSGTIDVLSDYNGYDVSGFGLKNGKAVAIPQNGQPPYQYHWSSDEFTATASQLEGGVNTVTITDNLGCEIVLSVDLSQPDPMTCATDVTNTPCPGSFEGAISLSASGGVTNQAYQYNWQGPDGYTSTSGSITGLGEGVYFVTVTDANGNTTSCNATISSQSNMVLNVNILSDYNGYDVSSPAAADGKAEAVVSGGVTPYTYQWSTGDQGQTVDTLHAGTVSVTVTDALGCTVTGSVTLTAPGVFSCSVATENTVCPGSTDGTAAVILSGGVLPAQYLWIGPGGQYSDSLLTNLSQGTYFVTVTDANGVTTSCSGTVEQLSQLQAAVQLISNASSMNANDGSAEVFATGANSYTYQWSNGETTKVAVALPGGPVSVTVTDDFGCTTSITFVVPVDDMLLIDFNVQDVSCNGLCDGKAAASVVGGTAPYDFLWSGGQTDKIIDNLCAGEITLTVTDANGVTGTASVTINEPDSLKIDFVNVTHPTTFSSLDGSVTAQVEGGTPPYSYIWNDGNPPTITPTLSNVGPGDYLLVVSDDNNCTVSGQIKLLVKDGEDCFKASKILTPSVLDGSNDVFNVTCLDVALEVDLQVFSRWGELVYHKRAYDGTWTGVDNNGNDLPEGGYFWVMTITDINGEKTTKKGHVTIVR